jgi:tRNA A-37 threonylcarbamoyl transferase component Bud32
MSFEKLIQQSNLGIYRTHEVIKGGNSVVIKSEKSNGNFVAVKIYQGTELRKNAMLKREVKAINFLRTNGVDNLPSNLEVRTDLGLIAYDWIEGTIPIPNEDCIDSIVSMCIKLFSLREKHLFFDDAVDAAFSVSDIEHQVQTRLLRLRDFSDKQVISQLLDKINSRLFNFSRKNDQSSFIFNKTFSISDLGSHNMLVNSKQFFFIDFEFFGVDSTEKMLGDFLLHPRNEFSKLNIEHFLNDLSNKIPWNKDNYKNIFLLLTLKWATITLERVLRKQTFHSDVELVNSIEQSYAQSYLDYFDFINEDSTLNLTTFRSFNDRML